MSNLRAGVWGNGWGQTAMPINPFREQGAFDPEVTAAMGAAFDAACNELCEVGRLQMVRKLVAQRIIAAARNDALTAAQLRPAPPNGPPLVKTAPASYPRPTAS